VVIAGQFRVNQPTEKQRTVQWFKKRRGKITCSRLNAVQSMSRAYARDIIREREGTVAGTEGGWAGTATEWGINTEKQAVAAYELRNQCTVRKVGFEMSHDRDYFGGSADGLVGRWGGIEVKCPEETAYHTLNWVRGMDPYHMAQVQGLIYVYRLAWLDFVSFDPRVRASKQLYIERILPDPVYTHELLEKVDNLWAIVLSGNAGVPEASITDAVPTFF